MKEKDILKSRDGFTLIEIIVVLIILSILAVVAAVKYVDITSDSQQTAVDTVLFDAAARYNMAYAKYMLLYSDKPTKIDGFVLSDESVTNSVTIEDEGEVGDFTITWGGTSAGGVVTITVTGVVINGVPSWYGGFTGSQIKTIPFHPSD